MNLRGVQKNSTKNYVQEKERKNINPFSGNKISGRIVSFKC
jgi:hypothetical protein